MTDFRKIYFKFHTKKGQKKHIYYDEGEFIDVETVCGTAVVSGNTAMLQIIEENDDNELECTVIMLSK